MFEELRRWRFKKAQARRVPAYMIFNDATLDELARVKPRTQEELLAIKGIGPSKARGLGKEALAIIADSAPAAPVEELSSEAVEDEEWAEEEF